MLSSMHCSSSANSELFPVKRERTGAMGETAVSSCPLKGTRRDNSLSEVRRDSSCCWRRRATFSSTLRPVEVSGSQLKEPPLPPSMLSAVILISSGGLL